MEVVLSFKEAFILFWKNTFLIYKDNIHNSQEEARDVLILFSMLMWKAIQVHI